MVKLPGGMIADAVIFDFDGVIVDTEPLHYQAFQDVLNPLGISFSWQEYTSNYMGFDDRDAFNEVFKKTGVELSTESLKKIIHSKALCFISIIKNGIKSYPGVIELIKSIKKSQTPLAISSGALRSDINPILEIFGVVDCFDIIVTADDVSKSKPDPECYTLAHKKLEAFYERRILPNQVVAIEDTPAGITAAKSAGLSVIAVSNSYTADYLTQANYTLKSLKQSESNNQTEIFYNEF